MKKKITSINVFPKQCNVRAGGGPVYSRFCPPKDRFGSNISNRLPVKEKNPCFGPYDNIVDYVWEVDVSNGNHFAYVDCDYVE